MTLVAVSPLINPTGVKELVGVVPPKAIDVGLTPAVIVKALARTVKVCGTWVAAA